MTAEHMNAGNPVESLKAWMIRNPVKAWWLQWVLLLVGM
jgi:hypothetical protein